MKSEQNQLVLLDLKNIFIEIRNSVEVLKRKKERERFNRPKK